MKALMEGNVSENMRHVKSERLKKLESELSDLEQWLKLGLVPKKDIDKHKNEISGVKARIEEEKERLQSLKESGEAEEYITPKKTALRGGYNDMPTIPDIDMDNNGGGGSDTGFDMDTDVMEVEHTSEEKDEEDLTENDTDDESYFSDKNRWRRGGIVDPDANDW